MYVVCTNMYLHFRTASKSALHRAKRNLIKHYAVVGTLDQIRDYMGVLQCLMPHMFDGALDIYDRLGKFISLFVIKNKEIASYTVQLWSETLNTRDNWSSNLHLIGAIPLSLNLGVI